MLKNNKNPLCGCCFYHPLAAVTIPPLPVLASWEEMQDGSRVSTVPWSIPSWAGGRSSCHQLVSKLRWDHVLSKQSLSRRNQSNQRRLCLDIGNDRMNVCKGFHSTFFPTALLVWEPDVSSICILLDSMWALLQTNRVKSIGMKSLF